MRENNLNIFETFVQREVTTEAEVTAWESSCLKAMYKSARQILWNYPCAAEEIEDVVQDALRSTLAKIRSGKAGKIENHKEYLIIAAANHAINKAKTLNRKKYHLSLDEDDAFDIASKLMSHSKRLEIRMMYEHCLKSLSYKERTISEMLRLGMSRAEIANSLSMRETTVNVSAHRIRRKLSPLEDYLTW